MAAREKPNPSASQERAFSRVRNDPSVFQDLVVPFEKRKPAARQRWGRGEMLSYLES